MENNKDDGVYKQRVCNDPKSVKCYFIKHIETGAYVYGNGRDFPAYPNLKQVGKAIKQMVRRRVASILKATFKNNDWSKYRVAYEKKYKAEYESYVIEEFTFQPTGEVKKCEMNKKYFGKNY